MVGNPEDTCSRIVAQIISMSQFHFTQIDNFSSSNQITCRAPKSRYNKDFVRLLLYGAHCLDS